MWHIRRTVVGLLLSNGLLVAGQRPCFCIEPLGAVVRPAAKNAIVVTIRPIVEMDSRIIRLGDVATIACSDSNLRDKLKQLDLEDALSAGESVTIGAPQIKFRLQVAGINGDRISIRGDAVQITARRPRSQSEAEQVKGTAATSNLAQTAAQVKITTPSNLNSRRPIELNATAAEEGSLEREVIQAAQTCVLSRLPWPADSIDIRLLQPVPTDVRQVGLADGYELTADLRSTGPAVGRVQVRVIAAAPQRPTVDVPIVLEVRHFDKIVVASRALERGHVVTASDLYMDRQDVTDLTEYCSSINDLIGMTLKRSIRALQPLRLNDLDAAAKAESVVLVKRREQVKMVARVGGVSIEAMGEALQDGRLGDTIRLRNIESNANIQGRVTRLGEVEISF